MRNGKHAGSDGNCSDIPSMAEQWRPAAPLRTHQVSEIVAFFVLNEVSVTFTSASAPLVSAMVLGLKQGYFSIVSCMPF